MAYSNIVILEQRTIKSYVTDFKIAEMVATSGYILILYILLISILYKNNNNLAWH